MGATLVAGRFFTAEDVETRPRVLIIDNRLAKRFWPNGDALGKRMYFPQDISNLMATPQRGADDDDRRHHRADAAARHSSIRRRRRPAPTTRRCRSRSSRTLGVAIRTTQSPESLTNAVRREIAQIDPEMPFYGVRTMEDRLSTSLMDRRTPMLLATGFAGVALFLAAIGIYGVLAYQVSQRRREIGIRMALGAESGSIFNLVLKEGGLIVGLGAVFGLVGAFFLRQTLQAQLYETGAMDPRVVAAVAGMLIAVALDRVRAAGAAGREDRSADCVE